MKKSSIALLVFLLVSCSTLTAREPQADLKSTMTAVQSTAGAPTGSPSTATPPGANPGGQVPNSTPLRPLPTDFFDPNAPTFFVATDGSDESGDGTADAPWATITHALDSVADGSLILVRPGLYSGRVRIRGQFAKGVTVRSLVPYQAVLRADETVLTIYEAQGISIESFDIAHTSRAAGPLVIQIQDLIGEPGGTEFTSRITLRDNIIHDAYNNDLLKINNGAQQILVTGNLFYNQGDSDEHIDINSARDVVVEDNIFFNDFAASRRQVTGESSSFIVVKDSNGDEDGIIGSEGITIRRNIFLHYEGSTGHNMLLLGEDGHPYYEASGVMVENNLFLGDGAEIRAPLGTKGVHNVVFRHNTISGDMPGRAFAWRSNMEGENQVNDNIQITNNIFSDPTGSMNNFATAPGGETASFTLANNLYWNGGLSLPAGSDDMVQIRADPSPVDGDPLLNPPAGIPLPVWDAASGVFGDGSEDIRMVFLRLVQAYGTLQEGSAAIDRADPAQTSAEDILGQPRRDPADLGAYEVQGNEVGLALPTSAFPQPTAVEPGNNPGTGPSAVPVPSLGLPAEGGWVTYAVQDGDNEIVYRLELAPGAIPNDITQILEGAAAGQYSEWLNVSKNGTWYITSTDRFDPECAGWPCLVVTQDFVRYEVVKAGGATVHAGPSAISNDGSLIVYLAGGGSHERDLFVIHRQGVEWSAALELTTQSPFNIHQRPGLSEDGQKAVFACGDDPYISRAICEVNTDGNGFRVRFRANEGGSEAALFSPDYAPDGSIVFEGEWAGEQVWRLPAGSSTPVLVSQATNDNSPCVLPNGMIVSLWLGREGNSQGNHEIKLMSADGRQYTMVLTGVDVFDIGLGCGQ